MTMLIHGEFMAELRLTYMAEVRLDIYAIYYFEQLSPKTVVNVVSHLATFNGGFYPKPHRTNKWLATSFPQ